MADFCALCRGKGPRHLVVVGVRMQELAEEAEHARDRLSILAEVGGLLGASIDLVTMVSAVARLLVSRLVDVCAIELLEGPGVPPLTVVEPGARRSRSSASSTTRRP